MGAYAMTTRDDGNTTIVAASAPRPWPRPFNKEVWHIEEEPSGPGRIWMSNKGRILWNAPSDEGTVTFEERALPSESSGIEQRILDLDTPPLMLSGGNSSIAWMRCWVRVGQ